MMHLLTVGSVFKTSKLTKPSTTLKLPPLKSPKITTRVKQQLLRKMTRMLNPSSVMSWSMLLVDFTVMKPKRKGNLELSGSMKSGLVSPPPRCLRILQANWLVSASTLSRRRLIRRSA